MHEHQPKNNLAYPCGDFLCIPRAGLLSAPNHIIQLARVTVERSLWWKPRASTIGPFSINCGIHIVKRCRAQLRASVQFRVGTEAPALASLYEKLPGSVAYLFLSLSLTARPPVMPST